MAKTNKKKVHTVSPLRRSQRKKKFRFDSAMLHEYGLIFTRKHRKKNETSLTDLPTEIIIKIFSYLPSMELYYKMRLTCTKMKNLSMAPQLWKKLYIDGKLPPSRVEYLMINSGKVCEELSLENRNDTNIILDLATKHVKNIKSIEIKSCKGSKRNPIIKSGSICKLITRCKNLYRFSMDESRFISCKFFTLLAEKVAKDKNDRKLKFIYEGPLDYKQMKVFFGAVKEVSVLQISRSSFRVHEGNGRFEWADIENDNLEDDPNYVANDAELDDDDSDNDDDNVRYELANDYFPDDNVHMQID